MNLDQYQTEALKTESPIDADLLVRYSEVGKALGIALSHIQVELDALDAYKKYIFYNKPMPDEVQAICDVLPEMDNINTGTDHSLLRMLHGLLGVLTESGETLEQVGPALFDNDESDVDWCNLSEEIGDKLWYLAIMADACNIYPVTPVAKNEAFPPNLPFIAMTNIEKLRCRYPNAFTQDSAQRRDLDAERAVLEKEPEDNE
jgi:NTP pyrophosphatase (non-canonical NTP hydrolase)